jgi:hypothetical protein
MNVLMVIGDGPFPAERPAGPSDRRSAVVLPRSLRVPELVRRDPGTPSAKTRAHRRVERLYGAVFETRTRTTMPGFCPRRAS